MDTGPVGPAKAFTVCFCGTDCTRDEGEVSRKGSDKRIYAAETGYIPVRIHREITGDLRAVRPSVTVRGVGQNDWAEPRDSSEPLVLNGPLRVPSDLVAYAQPYSGNDQRSTKAEILGAGAVALALHGANLAAASGADMYHLIGHSRGGVECVMAAWFLYAYGNPRTAVRIFAIDPVPGPGNWAGIITQLPPNVVQYVGVTAWDHDNTGFNGLVPRPSGTMTGDPTELILGGTWETLADHYQLANPLTPSGSSQPIWYKLYACRGRHGTVAGLATDDGQYDPDKASVTVTPVPDLVYKMARSYLTDWGTVFAAPSAVSRGVPQLRQLVNLDHVVFDDMGGGPLRTANLLGRPNVRLVSSSTGRNPLHTSYLEDVAGDPPYRQPYPVTAARTGAGWVHWTYL